MNGYGFVFFSINNYFKHSMFQESGQVVLLESTDPIFEELESHQVSLQAMQSNSAAGSFLDEVVKWQKRLQTIEAVLSTWLEVQEKWVELEEVGMVSSEKNGRKYKFDNDQCLYAS